MLQKVARVILFSLAVAVAVASCATRPSPPPRTRSLADAVKAVLDRGEALLSKKRFLEARDHFERSAAILEKAQAGCAAGVLFSRAAAASYSLGDIARAATLLSRAVDLCERKGGARVVVGYLPRLAAYRKMLGDFALALATFEKLERLSRQLGDELGRARALGYQGTELANLGRASDSDRVFSEALAIARRLGNTALEADLLASLGNACGRRSEYDCAVRSLREALRLREKMGKRGEIASALSDLGKVLSDTDALDEAISILERALAINEANKSDVGIAATAVNLGAAYRLKADHVRALKLYRRAEAIFGRMKGMERFQAVAVANIGNVYRAIGIPDEALAHHERALAIKERRGNKREIAETLHDIAVDLSHAGRSSDAIERAREAIRLFGEVGEVKAAAQTGVLLASFLELDGGERESREARELLERAAATLERLGLNLPLSNTLLRLAHFQMAGGSPIEEAEKTLARANEARRKVGLSESWIQLYIAAKISKRRAQAGDSAARDRVVSLLAQATRTIENERAALMADEFKMAFMAGAVFVHHELAETLIERANAAKDARERVEDVALAFDAIERARARGLVERIEATGGSLRPKDATSEVARREARLTARLQAVSRRLKNPRGDASAVAKLEETQRKLLGEIDLARAEMQAENPMLVAFSANVVSLAQVQRFLLGPNDTLLLYSVATTSTLLFAVTPTDARGYVIPLGRNQIGKRVDVYRGFLADPEVGRPKDFIRRGLSLSRDLLGAVDPSLLAGRNLVVVPDGALALLPFEALVVAGDPDKRRRTFLVERHAVSYAPSASVLAALRARRERTPPATTGFAAVADPVYDFAAFEGKRDEGAVGVAGKTLRAASGATWRGGGLPRLPRTADEVQRIAASVGTGPRTILLRDAAREGAIKAGRLNGHRFVHLATHGLLADNLQALVMTLDPKDADDGLLELREILGLKLDADLVALSACQTGEGRWVGGEGVVGLTHAFLHAGASRVVVSLWKVSDDATAELMVETYRRLGGSGGAENPAKALREAKLALLRGDGRGARGATGARGDFRAPFYWAAFVLVGLQR